MKNSISALSIGFFLSCHPASKQFNSINEKKPVYELCPGTFKLYAKKADFTNNTDQQVKLAAEIAAAAKSDALKSTSASADLKASGSLAQTIKANFEFDQSVSDEFWEQEDMYTKITCVMQAIMNNPKLNDTQRSEAFEDWRTFQKNHDDYVLNRKKKSPTDI